MRTVQEVNSDILGCFKRGEHEMEAGFPYENPLNDLQRELIETYAEEHGEAWLGRINLYRTDPEGPIIWKWNGELVLNFGARFVIPSFDEELERMILERSKAEYTGTKADYARISPIFQRIEDLGGKLLVWN